MRSDFLTAKLPVGPPTVKSMLINIQFLRFIAAFLVVLYHANTHVVATGVTPGGIFEFGKAVGFAGVDVFFVISGFIMFYTTREKRGVAASSDFLRRRLARIYSGYWPFFPMALLVFWWARPERLVSTDFVGSFFLWPLPLHKLLLDVSWTLTYELYFYALFTCLIAFGLGKRWWLMLCALGVFSIYCVWRHFVLHDFSEKNLYNHSFANLFLLSPFLIQFFAGAVLARFSESGSGKWGWILLLAGMAGFAGAGIVNVQIFNGTIEQGYYMVPRVLLFGIPSAMTLMGLVWLEHSGFVAPRNFALKAGGASYAIYLSHTIIQAITMKLGLNQALSAYSSTTVQLVFLLHSSLIVLFSVGWYTRVERPLNQVFKKVLRV